MTLMVFLSVQWWAAWYPGAEPGGGGYVAQRIFSARSERDGVLATLFFQVAHYALRPWPWIVTGLATVILYPNLQDKEAGYVQAFVDLLPTPWRGFMLAGFAAAYMTTVGTHLNWGASYLVNDFYKRFVKTDGDERHYVSVSRWATVLLFLASIAVTSQLSSIEKAWELLLALGAGTGLVLILRWYWWRINAWSEISAMVASFVVSTLAFTFVAPRFAEGRPQRHRRGDAAHGGGEHGGVGGGDLRHRPRAPRRARGVLPARSSRRPRVGAGVRAPRARAGAHPRRRAGVDELDRWHRRGVRHPLRHRQAGLRRDA